MIKSFKEKLQEASLQGNPAIPGEGGKPGSYLSDVEARASERNAELQRRHGREIPQFMGLVSRAKQIQRGHEAELEALAERAIRTMYGDILEEVELRITQQVEKTNFLFGEFIFLFLFLFFMKQ